jgi:hypothetical protein
MLVVVASVGQDGAATPLRSPHEFTAIAAACARQDGAAVVIDAAEPAIVVIARDGSARILGRRGSGPGEYQSPAQCFPVRGDSVLVLDRLLRRFVVVAPGGALATLPLPSALGSGWHEPLGVDEHGRVVLQGRTTDGRAPILAWNRATGGVDSLFFIALGQPREVRAGSITAAREIPFMPRDGAVAGIALGIAVVHPEPFRIGVRRDGQLREGAPIPYTPVAVDDRDVERYVASQAPPANTTARGSDGRVVTIPQRRWTLENFGLTRNDIPARKPSFDPAGMFAGPAGTLWVRVHRPSAERAERYEVRNPDGTRGNPVTLPEGRRLVGLGTTDALVVAVNDDGIQFLERIRLPR